MQYIEDIKLVDSNRMEWRYGQREATIIKNGLVKNYNFITLSNSNTNEFQISEYTDFFFHKKRLNNSIHTNKNNYGTTIVLFLNYIFFDREVTLNSIEDITVKIGEEFLNKFSYGDLRKGPTLRSMEVKTDEVIEKAEYALTSFYNWLFYQPNYKLNHIKKSDFNYETKIYKNKNRIDMREGFRQVKYLKSLFTVEYPHKEIKKKIESPDELMVYTLIEVAKQYDPMLAFGIALQSFAGLRCGEVCQMSRSRIVNRRPLGESISFCIDLTREHMLRNDGARTGEIKVSRVQLVYEAFLPYINRLYTEHMKLLRQKGLDGDEYGALFFGKNRKALKADRYADRYNKLITRLIERLGYMADNGNIQASVDFEMLLESKMNTHALRYFFTDYVARREDAHTLAMYRGDSSLTTALTYLSKSRGRVEYIKEIQNSFIESYEQITKTSFIRG